MRLAEDPEPQAVSCSDPFRAFDARVESLVRRMRLKAGLREVEGARDGERALAGLARARPTVGVRATRWSPPDVARRVSTSLFR